MIISIIAAIDERGTIGQNNAIPWRQAADLKRFRQLTSVTDAIEALRHWRLI